LHGVSTNSVRATPLKQKQIYTCFQCIFHCCDVEHLNNTELPMTEDCVQSKMVQWNRHSKQNIDGAALTQCVLTPCNVVYSVENIINIKT
jgi:hypothetical protein